jgi:lipoyl(octanoyl) transferase
MITVRELGGTGYAEALERMRRHVATRAGNPDAAGDEIWLTEHPPVFTLGFASRKSHLRDPGSIAVVETERGGQVTYHGPGQVVAYVLLDLRRRKLGVRDLVTRLEDGILRCLDAYGVAGLRRPGAPGIFVAQAATLAKIASIGLKVSRGLTWHGVALNGRMDLEPFSRIDPCGYPGQVMTDVATESAGRVPVEVDDLGRRLGSSLAQAIEG